MNDGLQGVALDSVTSQGKLLWRRVLLYLNLLLGMISI